MKKILVAEDDSFLIQIYKIKIAKAGFDVRVAQDGEEVFTVLKDFTPDVILLDLIMPNKDGFETLKELKASDKWKNIPVIITSNLGQTEDMEKTKKLGAVDYVIKSDTPIQTIIEKVKQFAGEETSKKAA
jgi:two-component system alkaline phosphatase synthesis response regulator PhoP